jgi:hypothetical protein
MGRLALSPTSYPTEKIAQNFLSQNKDLRA